VDSPAQRIMKGWQQAGHSYVIRSDGPATRGLHAPSAGLTTWRVNAFKDAYRLLPTLESGDEELSPKGTLTLSVLPQRASLPPSDI
jgi:hypothetical protein